MKIAIMGSGGIGGYYGGRLAAAGNDVTFIARGAHLAAMQDSGLRLEGPHGNFHISPCRATDDPKTIGPVDVVLFSVKLYDTEEAAELIKPIVGPETMVISLMNGVDGPERIARVVGGERVLGGAAYISALIAEPGSVRYISELQRVVFGELSGGESKRANRFLEICRAAGLDAEVSDNIMGALWTKFVLLATNASLTSLVRQPTGVVYHDDDLVWLARGLMGEVVALAAAKGFTLAEDVIDKSLEVVRQFPPDMYASMYHDLNRGKRMELESLSGLVARMGTELGVDTRLHRTVYACLKPYANGA